jgi:hypothetical protein
LVIVADKGRVVQLGMVANYGRVAGSTAENSGN